MTPDELNEKISKDAFNRELGRLMPIERVNLSNCIIDFWNDRLNARYNLEACANGIRDSYIKEDYLKFLKITGELPDNLDDDERQLQDNFKGITRILRHEYSISGSDIANHVISRHFFIYPIWLLRKTKKYGMRTKTEKYLFNLLERKIEEKIVIDEPYSLVDEMMNKYPQLFIKRPPESGFANENGL